VSVVLLRGDARHLPLPDESVDLIACSPPYWSLRDYRDGGESLAGQIGSEDTPQEYVASLLDCTREWARVLKPSGSMFVNLADVYYSAKGNPGPNGTDPKNRARRGWQRPTDRSGLGFPRKTLLGLPARYEVGCIDDLGLILRRDIIWSKPNGLPESVTDRCRSSHEYVFHLVKQPRYYAAVDEIREPQAEAWRSTGRRENRGTGSLHYQGIGFAGVTPREYNPLGKLPGSVWDIPSQPLTVPDWLGIDHFAAFPMELPRRCILGWSPPGICTACGEGRRPVSERSATGRIGTTARGGGNAREKGFADFSHINRNAWQEGVTYAITGYACACTPFTDHPERRGRDFHAGTDRALQGMNDGNGGERYRRYVDELENPRGPVREYHFDRWLPAPTRPAIVLDPFGGTGCTALVADVLGRTGISVDLSMDYARIARWRTRDPGERARALQVPKPPPVPDGQESLFEVGA
jgi:DNA modification methylase